MALTDIGGSSSLSGAGKTAANYVGNISAGVSKAITYGINKYVLNVKGNQGIYGFVFDYEDESRISLQSEITDHYMESNAFVNDHIARKPMRVTLRGFSGEAVQTATTISGVLQTLQNKLTTLPSLLGKYTPGAVQKIQSAVTNLQNVANEVDNAIGKAKSIFGMVVGFGTGPTKQQQAYQKLYGAWQAGVVFDIDTPFNHFPNMAIESVVMVQDAMTKEWSDICVTLKEMRFADVVSTSGVSSAQVKQQQGDRSLQTAAAVYKGKLSGFSTKLGLLAFK